MGRKITTEEFKYRVKAVVGDLYELADGEYYHGPKVKLKMKHNECGCIYEVNPSGFINGGHRCPNCAVKNSMSPKSFERAIQKEVGQTYLLCSEYLGAKVKVMMYHKPCRTHFEVLPNDFLDNNKRCPVCNK